MLALNIIFLFFTLILFYIVHDPKVGDGGDHHHEQGREEANGDQKYIVSPPFLGFPARSTAEIQGNKQKMIKFIVLLM